ncbi:MAG: glucose-6-phosphate dehydrogenase, partial [Bacteroidota bacterium]
MENKKGLPPTIIFIFGGSGDLTNRKLIPALYNLYLDKYLPEKFVVVGVGRTSFASDDEYRAKLLEGVQQFSRRKGEVNGEWNSF